MYFRPGTLAITKPSCSFTDEDTVYFDTAPVAKGQAVDGLIIKASIARGRGDELIRRHCLVTAIASIHASKTLTANLSLTVTTAAGDDDWEADDIETVQAPVTSSLSSDVFITSPITVDETGTGTYIADASMTANGATTSLVKGPRLRRSQTRRRSPRTRARSRSLRSATLPPRRPGRRRRPRARPRTRERPPATSSSRRRARSPRTARSPSRRS